jgi:hypothetical protein
LPEIISKQKSHAITAWLFCVWGNSICSDEDAQLLEEAAYIPELDGVVGAP